MSSEYEEPATSRRHYREDSIPTVRRWRTMLAELARHGEDDCLEEDAPDSLLSGGDDDCVEGRCSDSSAVGGEDALWRRMLRQLVGGGDDDCVGGGCSAEFTPRW